MNKTKSLYSRSLHYSAVRQKIISHINLVYNMSDCDKCYEENKIEKGVQYEVGWPG